MIFETKKVSIETLGEYLTEVREHLGLSISEVAESTGIADKFIQYLEAGSYYQLPPDVYVFGFLKKLAELYSLSTEVLVSQYKKERGIGEKVVKEKIDPQKSLKSWFSKITITPKLISLFGGIGLSFIAMFYIAFQVSAINRTPGLAVEYPMPGTVIKDSVVTIGGHTDIGSTVSINGQNVFVDPSGNFVTTLGVAAGQKELNISAQNKYGKTSTQKIAIIVDPTLANPAASEPEQKAETKMLSMEIKFTRPTTITLTRDGVELPEEVVPANGIKHVEAKTEVVLKTSDAGGTLVTINGKELGPLGRAHESLTVPFTIDNELLTEPATATATTPSVNKKK